MYDSLETERLLLQERLDGAKTQSARNALGQFATPSALATHILLLCQRMLSSGTKIRFLDPAFGLGAFYSALLRTFPRTQIESALGYEIDPHYGLPAQQLWQECGLDLKIADFTTLAFPKDKMSQVNLLVCNPPYVRHHHLSSEDKARLHTKALAASGISLSGLAGLYNYFVLIANEWLADDGLACWLIPNEVLDVNYGVQIKRYLLEEVTLLRVHQFDPNIVQFRDALVSSVLVWFRKSKAAPDHKARFSYGADVTQPSSVVDLPVGMITAEAKWSKLYLPSQSSAENKLETNLVRLSELFEIKRGIATGANEYFILSKSQIDEHELPHRYLKPLLPSPRYLITDEILADEEGNPLSCPMLYLLDCSLPEEQVKNESPTLWQYLQLGKEQGVHQRYLPAHRSPWYSQEHRPPAPILCTYMGRQTEAKDNKAFRFIFNHSRATVANVYLMLYPKPRLISLLASDSGLVYRLWQTLQTIDGQSVIGEGRTYGGKLHKIEPKELGNLPLYLTDTVIGIEQQLDLFVSSVAGYG